MTDLYDDDPDTEAEIVQLRERVRDTVSQSRLQRAERAEAKVQALEAELRDAKTNEQLYLGDMHSKLGEFYKREDALKIRVQALEAMLREAKTELIDEIYTAHRDPDDPNTDWQPVVGQRVDAVCGWCEYADGWYARLAKLLGTEPKGDNQR